jgi:hypothetical protein
MKKAEQFGVVPLFILTFISFYGTIKKQKRNRFLRFLFREHCKISSTLKGVRAAQRILTGITAYQLRKGNLLK